MSEADTFCKACGCAAMPSISLPAFEPVAAQVPHVPVGEPLGARRPARPGRVEVTDVGEGAFALTMLGYFAMLFLLHYRFIRADVPMSLGWALGGGLLWPGLVVGIARLFGARRWRRNMLIWVPIFAGLAFVGSFSQLGVLSHFGRSEADRKQMHDAAVALEDLATKQQAGRPVDAPREPVAAPTTGTGTESIGQALGNIATLLREQAQRNQARQARMQSLHIETTLTPAALTSASSIADSRQRLEEFFNTQQEVFSDYESTAAAGRAELERLPIGARESALAGLATTEPRARAAMENFKDVESRLHDRFTRLLDLGQANIGVSYTAGNKIYLPKPALATYQSLIQDIRGLVVQEAAAKAELRNLQQDSVRRLSELERLTRDGQ